MSRDKAWLRLKIMALGIHDEECPDRKSAKAFFENDQNELYELSDSFMDVGHWAQEFNNLSVQDIVQLMERHYTIQKRLNEILMDIDKATTSLWSDDCASTSECVLLETARKEIGNEEGTSINVLSNNWFVKLSNLLNPYHEVWK